MHDTLGIGGVRERLLQEMQHKVLGAENSGAEGICVPFKFVAKATNMVALDPDLGVLNLKPPEKWSPWRQLTRSGGGMVCDEEANLQLGN
ncbi:hypothetical protein ACOSQ3_019701 [Xanthoceras sorbifolium]